MFWVVIPARRASSRLPNKPLADIGGAPMVVRVAEQAKKSGADRVIVATDDDEIRHAVERHDVEAMLTRTDHPSGTDRIAEVAESLRAPADQILINVQGDEPLIEPELITQVAQTLHQSTKACVATAATPIHEASMAKSIHVVKVVCNAHGHALYFSRAPIPFDRDGWQDLSGVGMTQSAGTAPLLRHIGIYGFRAFALQEFVRWPACALEGTEQLEQLRWLWHGQTIAVHITDNSPHAGVDTPEDLQRVRALWATRRP
jgi:3-deoxy-manno-octulosonate cytidylyltransferase (CMP-KDO synthetase)